MHRQSLGSKIRPNNQVELPPRRVPYKLPPIMNALEQH